MDPTHSHWQQIVRRAGALRRRYRHLSGGPDSSWSLVNRAAQRFRGEEGLPDVADPDRFRATWTRAMVSVLNDLYRRQRASRRAGFDPVPLAEEPAAPEAADTETLPVLREVLEQLAALDERAGSRNALVVSLRYHEGLTWREIAAVLDSSITSVRRDWAFGMAWLRHQLEKRGIEGAEAR